MTRDDELNEITKLDFLRTVKVKIKDDLVSIEGKHDGELFGLSAKVTKSRPLQKAIEQLIQSAIHTQTLINTGELNDSQKS